MRVKHPNKISNWQFTLINPAGEEITVGPHSSLNSLLDQVMSYIEVYDGMTDREYSKKQRQLAMESGIDFRKYMLQLTEHQMCLNFRNKGVECWSSGLGDDTHNLLAKVDGFVEKIQSAPVKRIISRAIEIITPSKSKTLGGCSSCGGSRVMKPESDNLGRAGRLNRLFRK